MPADTKMKINRKKVLKNQQPDSDSDSDYETISSSEEHTTDSSYEEDDDGEEESDEISLGSQDTDEDEAEDAEEEPTPEEIRKTISKIFPSKYISKKVKADEKKSKKQSKKGDDDSVDSSLDRKRHNTRSSKSKKSASKTKKSTKDRKRKVESESEADSNTESSSSSDISETDLSDIEENFDSGDRKNINIILGFGPGGQEEDDEYMEDEYALRDEEDCDSDDEKTFMKETYQHVEIPEEFSTELATKKTKKGKGGKNAKNKSPKNVDTTDDTTSKFDAEYAELIDMKKYLVERLKKNPNSKMWLKSLKECNNSIKKLVKKERGNNTKEYHKMINSQNKKFTSEIDYFKRKLSKQEQQKALTDFKTVNEHMQIDKPYRLSILESNLPTKHKATVLQKLNILRNMQPGDPEYSKMKNWIDTFMRIPFGIYRSLDIKLSDGTEECQAFMERSIKVLDDCVYGMYDAKMQVIQMIGQWITNPSAMGTAIAIKGAMGTGKCLGRDTPILMYDGSIKMVQDIVVGDVIMGDDSTPRNILSLARGEDDMYEVAYPDGTTYRVNSEHILTLKRSRFHPNETVDVCIKDYLITDNFTRKSLQGFRTSVSYPKTPVPFDPYLVGLTIKHVQNILCGVFDNTNIILKKILNHYKFNEKIYIPKEYIINDYDTRIKIFNAIVDASIFNNNNNIARIHTTLDMLEIRFPFVDIIDDFVYLARSIGIDVVLDKETGVVYLKNWSSHKTHNPHTENLYDIEVRPIGRDTYYGFEIDGNRRFVLGDFTVTHNTSLVKEGISKILGREFAFIALGGAGDSSFLEGHSYTYEGSSWGKIIQILIDSKCMNPVIYFDELDKLSDSSRGAEITGILTHLTDTSQNTEFHDKYFSEVSFDLSKCLFIFSYNDESKVNPILRDRMYRIQTKGYSPKEKVIIAKNFILPKIREQVNFGEGAITIPDDVIEYIITKPAFTKNEEGVRNLKRCLEIIYTKLNLFRLIKPDNALFSKEINLKVEFPYTVTKKDADLLIKDDETTNNTFLNMYI